MSGALLVLTVQRYGEFRPRPNLFDKLCAQTIISLTKVNKSRATPFLVQLSAPNAPDARQEVGIIEKLYNKIGEKDGYLAQNDYLCNLKLFLLI